MVATDETQETAVEVLRPDFAPALGDNPQLAHRAVISLKTNIGVNSLFLGLTLQNINNFKLYEELGHPTFESYLTDPEVTLSRADAYRKMKTAVAFLPGIDEQGHPVIEEGDQEYIRQLSSIDPSKLDIIAPVVARALSHGEVDEWLAKAETLTNADLRAEVRRANGHEPPPEKEYLENLGKRISAMAARLHKAADPTLVLAEIVLAIDEAMKDINKGKVPGAGNAPNKPMTKAEKAAAKAERAEAPKRARKAKAEENGAGTLNLATSIVEGEARGLVSAPEEEDDTVLVSEPVEE